MFQSYNLIPHQSILANVELALTIGGLSPRQRHMKAKKALEEVGLGNQLHKKPNQMSGGQMQRVAIARALVNDPDILLADEPTGALDSETSIQVMELLKDVAKDRLVVMVTHNAELAEKYSTRIVKLCDGKIIDDSYPYEPCNEELQEPEYKRIGKARMNFFTSLTLSFHNLRTKKGRTILTSFAGSIGIIGIALVLALSVGVNDKITSIQKETMTSYPITISAETVDLSGLMGMHGQTMSGEQNTKAQNKDREGIYGDNSQLEVSNALNKRITENDLTAFKKYLDNPDSEIQQYLGENGVVYTYDVNFEVYSYDSDNNIINSNADPGDISDSYPQRVREMNGGNMAAMFRGGTSGSGADNFSELMAASDGSTVSKVITDNYELIYGSWPENYDEVVLVLDENNAMSTETLYQLGFITAHEYKETAKKIESGAPPDEVNLDYETVCGHIFYLVPACSHYSQNIDGTFSYIGEDLVDIEQLLENSINLKITGVIRPLEDAVNAPISTAVAYTSKLTEYVINYINEAVFQTVCRK